jgi:hypothetical protein
MFFSSLNSKMQTLFNIQDEEQRLQALIDSLIHNKFDLEGKEIEVINPNDKKDKQDRIYWILKEIKKMIKDEERPNLKLIIDYELKAKKELDNTNKPNISIVYQSISGICAGLSIALAFVICGLAYTGHKIISLGLCGAFVGCLLMGAVFFALYEYGRPSSKIETLKDIAKDPILDKPTEDEVTIQQILRTERLLQIEEKLSNSSYSNTRAEETGRINDLEVDRRFSIN